MKKLLILLSTLLTFSSSALEPGQPVPTYLGKTLTGDPIFPQELQGKVVLISFWASWCAPCNRELPYLRQIQAKWGDQVQVLAINQYEDDETLAKHSKRFDGTQIMQGRDRKGIISNMFGVDGIPHAVIVDKLGNVAHVHSGFFPNTGEKMLQEVEALIKQ